MYHLVQNTSIKCGLISLVLISFLDIKCQDMKFDYTVEIPKFICDNKEDIRNGVTTIRLLGKDAQKLQYKFNVNFKNINSCKQSQRCTLIAWRAVRNLEKHLQRASSFQNSSQEININNTMLIPGIQYVLTINVTNNGNKVDDKQYILECTNSTIDKSANISKNDAVDVVDMNNPISNSTNESALHSEEKSHPSLILLGTNVTYRDIVYILNAEATDCDVNCNYYFKWEILDHSENIVLREPTKGSELQIASNSLIALDYYTVRCSLMSTQKGALITTALQNVTVLRKGIVLKLAVSRLLVGPKQPFRLLAYLRDADNLDGKTNIEWLCTSENRRQCSGFKTINTTVFESNGFPVLGRYNITIVVIKGATVIQDSCEIQVVVEGFARIDVDNTNEPIDPSKEIEISVYVSKLVASCMLQWLSIELSNYSYVSLQDVPGNVNVVTNITLKEDEFLNEIDEFSNNTVDIDYNLKISPPKGDWKGLKGNSSYLFRLNVTCPLGLEDEGDESIEGDSEPLLTQNYVTLYADVPLHTDSTPVLSSLEVIPTRGVALKTLFTLTYEADENNSDYLVLYKFGYFLNNEIIFVANLLGVTNTKSVLPYVEKGVKTVLEGCNSHSLCSQISGPIVITEIPPISEKDQNGLMQQLRELMDREEYYKVFTYSLAILQTYSNMNDDNLSTTMQNFISNLTSVEIKRLLMLNADGDKSWRISANNLMKNIGILLNSFSLSERLVNNVVALRNELSRNNLKLYLDDTLTTYSSRKLLMLNPFKQRIKREIEKVTIEEVRSYFVISELIITTSRDKKRVEQEKQNLMNQLDKFLPGLCASLFENSQNMNLELKTLILSVEKINKNSFNRYVHILYTDNSWKVNGRIKLGRCFIEKLNSNQLCIGKVAFKNYLNIKGIVHMIKVYSAQDNDQLDLQEDLSCDSVLVLPLDERQTKEKEAACALWKKHWIQSSCKTLQVTTKTIQCSCNYLGYYSLQYNTISSTTETSIAVWSNPIQSSTTKLSTTDRQVDKNLVLDISTLLDTTSEISNSIFALSADPSIVSPVLTLSSIMPSEVVTSTEETPTIINTVSTTEQHTEEVNEQHTEVLATVKEPADNITLAEFYDPKGRNDGVTVLYCLIGFSVCGIGMLLYGIKQLSKEEAVHPNDVPKYALLYHQEMLQDLPSNG